ncbi:MAG: hypothetical protein Q7R86_02690 [bacterium]|nr:hypothetical protein [bacterium]
MPKKRKVIHRQRTAVKTHQQLYGLQNLQVGVSMDGGQFARTVNKILDGRYLCFR